MFLLTTFLFLKDKSVKHNLKYNWYPIFPQTFVYLFEVLIMTMAELVGILLTAQLSIVVGTVLTGEQCEQMGR